MKDQFHTPGTLPPEKLCPISIDRGLCGSESQFGQFGDEENLLPLPGIDSQVFQAIV